jgi:cytochrome c peroxidase
MHDGSVATLAAVMDYYKTAHLSAQIGDPDFRPLDLTQQDKDDLVEFMRALTGEILNADPPLGFPL